MSVVVVGISNKKAPLDFLEKVAISEEGVSKVLANLVDCPNVNEAVVISTCLRTEVYAVVDRFHEAVSEIQEVLAADATVASTTLSALATVRFDDEVGVHLFSVAAGLESSVLGEGEVLGQVRRAYERAQSEKAAGPVLAELFRHALHAGKRVRTETAIARGTTSFAHAAVELAAERHESALANANIGVVGAGEMGLGVIRALSERSGDAAAHSLTIFNRNAQRARQALDELGIVDSVRIESLDALATFAGELDVVISAVEVPSALLSSATLAPGGDRRARPLLAIDLGVPRNIDPVVRAHPGVTLFDMDDLAATVERAKGARRGEIDDAQKIVLEEVATYRQSSRERGAAPIIAALRASIETIRQREIDALSGEITPQVRDQIDRVSKAVLAKVLHEPTMVLRESAGTSKGERLVESLRSLFRL